MREDIYSALRRRIIRGDYEQGEIIREADIAQEFQVSRTPVREVFQNLQSDRLITLLPYRGAQVTFIELEFFFQTIAVKQTLEEMAARLAARWASEGDVRRMREVADTILQCDPERDFGKYLDTDTQFHRTVRQASRNGVLVGTLEQLQIHVERYYYYSRHIASKTIGDFHAEYTAIIDAIAAHDPAAASKAITTHMENYYEFVQAFYGSGR
jgi:DNA-binding GntR family transcriptional regulator